jgi:hypothetical protein
MYLEPDRLVRGTLRTSTTYKQNSFRIRYRVSSERRICVFGKFTRIRSESYQNASIRAKYAQQKAVGL